MLSVCAGDEAEGHLRVEGEECCGEVQRDVVGDVGVVGLGHADGADAGAVEAGIVAGELRGDLVEVHEVGDEELSELGVLEREVFAVDDEHLLDVGMLKGGEEDAFADHAGGSGEDDFEGHVGPLAHRRGLVFVWYAEDFAGIRCPWLPKDSARQMDIFDRDVDAMTICAQIVDLDPGDHAGIKDAMLGMTGAVGKRVVSSGRA